jgi:cell division protein FtsL
MKVWNSYLLKGKGGKIMPNQTSRRRVSTKTSTVRTTSTYQYGNTVRQFQALPNQYDKSERDKPKLSNSARKNREKALHMNLGYVMFLAVAVIVTLLTCISYLQLQSQMTQRVNNISSLEKEVADLKSDNDEIYSRINNSANLDDIKKVALDELGMSYASKDQVVLYDNEESDYVRQYNDIPKAKNSN